MRTPAGKECPYFFGDYYRGRHSEECRLIGDAPKPNHWTPDLCKNCPVPGIYRANACPNMVLEGRVKHTFLGLRKQMDVTAFCKKNARVVKEPEIGCGMCHSLPDGFEILK